jgi:hypothetical protein
MGDNPASISPRFAALPPPVIVVGMHRSGTSLIAGMLAQLGLFLDPAMPPPAEGVRLVPPSDQLRSDGYGEAEAFRLLNERILDSAGAAWNEIAPFLALRDDPGFSARSLETMRRATFTSLIARFLDHAPQAPAAWGWKDPRTSLLLPYWLRLFPEARILHVRRNAERVVESLVRRAGAASAGPPGMLPRLARAVHSPAAALRAVRRRLGLLSTDTGRPENGDRQAYLTLFEAYVAACEQYSSLAPDRYIEIAFEQALADPGHAAERLARFAELSASPARLALAAAFVRTDRPGPARQAGR